MDDGRNPVLLHRPEPSGRFNGVLSFARKNGPDETKRTDQHIAKGCHRLDVCSALSSYGPEPRGCSVVWLDCRCPCSPPPDISACRVACNAISSSARPA